MNVNEHISNKKSDNDLAKEYHLAGIYATICTNYHVLYNCIRHHMNITTITLFI